MKRRTIDPEGKRRDVLDAARALFCTEGFEATAIADVAARAGVAVGSVYRQFPTKRDLYAAVMADFEARFIEAMADPAIHALPPEKRFGPLMRALFDMAARQPDYAAMADMPQAALGGAAAARGTQTRVLIRTMITQGIASGAFRDIDPEAGAALAYGMVDGAMRACFQDPAGPAPERYITALEDAMASWVLKDR